MLTRMQQPPQPGLVPFRRPIKVVPRTSKASKE
jgi:hypothetical protein